MDITEIDYLRPGPYRPVDTFSRLRLQGARTPADVLDVLDRLREQDPAARYLCTLDDLNQCCYTNRHALEDDRLYAEDDDVDWESPEQVRAAEERTVARVAALLEAPGTRLDWTDVAGTLAVVPADVEALVAANLDPGALLDDVVYVQRVPVARDDLAVAGLVNGYFQPDWDVFQNHAVIRRLDERHGYRFFGIGASWLGFARAEPPGAEAAFDLVDELRKLYNAEGPWEDLAGVLQETTTLFLGYTEDFSATLG